MLRAHAATSPGQQVAILAVLVILVWVVGLGVAWGVASTVPSHGTTGGTGPAASPSQQYAPQRWLLVSHRMS